MTATLTKSGSIKMDMGRHDWAFVDMALRAYMSLPSNRHSPLLAIVLSMYKPKRMLVEKPGIWTLNITHASVLKTILLKWTLQEHPYLSNQLRLLTDLGRFDYLLSNHG